MVGSPNIALLSIQLIMCGVEEEEEEEQEEEEGGVKAKEDA